MGKELLKTSAHAGIDISIIIPVLNERRINQTIKRLYSHGFSGVLETIVVDGAKDQATIKSIEDKDVITIGSSPGRGCQMNAGANIASGKILLFLHCDTILPGNGLNQIINAMENLSVKAGAFDLSINGKGFAYRLIEKTASLRSRITRIPYGDQAIFMRKDYFFRIGQYRKIPIMEDVDLMRKVKNNKGKLNILKTRVVTSSRRWEKEGLVYGTFRNWVILALFFLGIRLEVLAVFYKNQKGI